MILELNHPYIVNLGPMLGVIPPGALVRMLADPGEQDYFCLESVLDHLVAGFGFDILDPGDGIDGGPIVLGHGGVGLVGVVELYTNERDGVDAQVSRVLGRTYGVFDALLVLDLTDFRNETYRFTLIPDPRESRSRS